MKAELVLLNYGSSNMASIRNALATLGFSFREIQSGPLPDPDNSIYILPGVGSFKHASTNLKGRGFDSLKGFQPRMIGICLGMQLLFEDSTEAGHAPGLGLLSGKIREISSHNDFQNHLRLPHVSWQPLKLQNKKAQDLGCNEGQYVYFIHSYMAVDVDESDVLASINFGSISIPAVVSRNEVIGFQFHPEKSGPEGLRLLHDSIEYLIKQ